LGITYSSKANLQVESYGFPEAQKIFYANYDSNDLPHPEPVAIDGASPWPLEDPVEEE